MVCVRRMICVAAAVLMTVSCASQDIGMALLAQGQNPCMAAGTYAANAKLKGDVDGAIEAWKKAIPSYENKGQPLTLAGIYKTLGELLVESRRVGEIPDIVEKFRAEMRTIDSRGIHNIDDLGYGFRVSELASVQSAEQSRRSQQEMYQMLKGADSRLLTDYYAVVGDDLKADEQLTRLTQLNAERAGTKVPSPQSMLREGTREEPTSSILTSRNASSLRHRAAYDRLMKVNVPSDPFDKQVRQAIVYTKQNDQRAVAAWDAVIEEVNRIDNEGTYDGVAARMKLDNLREVILKESLRTYRTLGTTEKSVEFVKEYIKKRESSRATIASESHKRSFQERGLEIYDSFIMITTSLPEENLDGMEQAKSRAMLDLMSGGIDRIDNAEVREIQRLQLAEISPGESSERGIALQGKLQALRQEHPEYYTLVSSEVCDRDDLAATLEPDMIALSYYLTEDTLFINVFGPEERTFFNSSPKRTEKVVSVPITVPEIALAVRQFRQGLMSTAQMERPAGGRIYLEYPLRNDGEEIVIVNESPLKLRVHEIRGETGRTSDARTMAYHVSSLVDTVAPGQRAVVMRFLVDVPEGGFPASEVSVDRTSTYRIKTNLGELAITNRVFAEPGEKVSVSTENRRDIVIGDSQVSLYDLLIKPVEELIKGKKLVIVPHGILHTIPFETLQGKNGRYLIEDHVVSYAPSLNVLKLVREKERAEPTRLVAYSDTLLDLRFARAEVEAIRGEFGEAIVLTGNEVTREAVTKTVSQGDVVHFACHGIFNPDAPLESGLVISSPSAANLSDVGQLEIFNVMDIMSVKVNPSLVFLSACDSGRAEITGGDEIVGLTRGFFVAGTPSVINTLWSIDDRSTAELVQRFYQNMFEKGMDKATALQDAKLHLIQEGFDHPFYWAAFVLQGDWQ